MIAGSAWRALDAPFLPEPHWAPVPGTCSRCGQDAALGETRWWHLDTPCRARHHNGPTIPTAAEFIPQEVT